MSCIQVEGTVVSQDLVLHIVELDRSECRFLVAITRIIEDTSASYQNAEL